MPFKAIVAGGRGFSDFDLLCDKLDFYFSEIPDAIEIVCGGARGADALGDLYAKNNALDVTYFPANWDKHGKQAGILRNIEMGEYADALVAFWDGKSSGTKHMIEYMDIVANKPVRVVRYDR
jgi:hypothetical protein